jgi:hypothetical protein
MSDQKGGQTVAEETVPFMRIGVEWPGDPHVVIVLVRIMTEHWYGYQAPGGDAICLTGKKRTDSPDPAKVPFVAGMEGFVIWTEIHLLVTDNGANCHTIQNIAPSVARGYYYGWPVPDALVQDKDTQLMHFYPACNPCVVWIRNKSEYGLVEPPYSRPEHRAE